ncbi:hypothetical protein BegalDRAFT_0732 [Beggiatoa alba B18LD]|uniref:DUF4154 domain-containing protein n=1 Tax=Beggiatoa alba B18LD TaxID=395493 RepID=I3CDF1_9GAMM|nr:YfiR family protein [Beggiatoa alba]EIJ41644.1 hypothetical protein BegalDRAFT_0732 [Beggiatoa alba B18LD]
MVSKLSFQLRFLLLLLGCHFSAATFANPPVAAEYQVKAAFLYNFANFVTWPSSAFTSNQQAFRICIFGLDPFELILDNVLENQNAKGRKIIAVRLSDINDLSNCHIVFISQSAQYQLKNLLNRLSSYAVLTVSDIPNFALEGGMIELFTVDNKIRLAINPNKLEQVGIKADANLLRLSKIVRPVQD